MADNSENREEPWNQPANDPSSPDDSNENKQSDDAQVPTHVDKDDANEEKTCGHTADNVPTIQKQSSSDSDTSESLNDNGISYGDEETDLVESLLAKQSGETAKLLDRLLGCAYGQALGDAYGLATEFEDRVQVRDNYPDKSKIIPFPDYVPTHHNRRWARGDWTDDTDQWILILETIMESDGDVQVFAKKLKTWIQKGYPELGDHGGMGLGANVSQVVHSAGYLTNPLAASETVWIRSGRQAAPNGAVMRCSASALVYFQDKDKMKDTTINMCKVTHFDPRCIASCLAVCLTITYLLNEKDENVDIEPLIEHVQKETIDILDNQLSTEHRDAFLWHTDRTRTLEDLNLDEPRSIGYTYKCLGSGFYGLRSNRSFEETLNDLIRYGGDADTNGAVCGTMFGARYGYKRLPKEWLRATPYKKWFDKKLIQCLKQMKIINQANSTTAN